MNKEKYLADRKALMDEANALLNEGKATEAMEKMAEVEKLDAAFEDYAKAAANMAALAGKQTVTPLAAVAVKPDAAVVVDKMDGGEPDNEAALYLSAFKKYLIGKKMDKDETTAFEAVNERFHNTVQTAAEHAVLIPDTVAKGIWAEMADAHPIIHDVMPTYVQGTLSYLKGDVDAANGAWYDEDDEVTDGSIVDGEVTLNGYELAKNVPVSWRLKKMAVDEFLAYITGKIAERMGAALAVALISGLGVPGDLDDWKAQPQGVATALNAETDTPQVVTWADNDALSYLKLTQLMAKIKSGYLNGACIYAQNAFIWAKLANLLDGQNRPLFIPDVTGGGVGRIFGLVVKEEAAAPTNGMLVGNMQKGYKINFNENISIHTEDHVKARTTDYMGYAIVDGKPITTKAFALLKKS